MKIRIENNRLSFSLTPAEVALFAHDGLYKEKVQIGDDSFTYVIQRTAELKVSASFKNNIITLLIPEKIADKWTSSDQVTIDALQDETELSVEKDFESPDVVDESHINSFASPAMAEQAEYKL